MTTQLSGTSGVTFPDASSQNTAATGFGFKNRILNPAMMIDQRNAGASVTPTTDGQYTIDRWLVRISAASKFSVQQNAGSVILPTGFTNYLGATSLSSYSIVSSDYFALSQRIEGLNIGDLGWGTAGASTVTLSFKVYSSLTGTFGGSIVNQSATRSYPFSYSVASPNTWTSISVTIQGDTAGAWVTTNGTGINVFFGLGVGSTYSGTSGSWAGATYLSATGATSVVGTSGATFYITGVQLEKGSTATSFDYRPYGTELQLCQRYCYVTGNNEILQTCMVTGATTQSAGIQFPVTMRSAPSFSISAGAGGLMQTFNDSQSTSSVALNIASTANANMALTAGAGAWTAGQAGRCYFGWSGSGQKATFSAEL